MTIIENKRNIIENKDSIFSYFGWPTVARINESTLAVVCSGYRLRHVCPFGKLVISYSYDEGKTWTKPAPVIDTPLDDRDGGICVDGKRIIVTSFNNDISFQRDNIRKCIASGDTSKKLELMSAYLNNVTEEECEKFLGSTYKISHDGGITFGDVKKCPVSSPHGPMKLKDGRILYVGKEFAPSGVYSRIACAVLDKDENFDIISYVPEGTDEYGNCLNCEPHALELDDGSILVAIRVQRYREHPMFTVFLTKSTDGCKTFSDPYRVIGTNAGSPPHLMKHSSGKIIMTYARRADNYGIRAIVSEDNGNTWSDEIIITDDAPGADLGYPSTVERSDNNLVTVWYEKEEDHSPIKQIVWKL